MAEPEGFLFNTKRINGADWVKEYLNKLNGAIRGDTSTKLSIHSNQQGKEYYVLETDGAKQDGLYINKGNRIHTWDFILPTNKKNKFCVYTIQADYRERFLEGVEMDNWVQKQVQANPSFTEDDFRFMSISTIRLNAWKIFHGRNVCLEETINNHQPSEPQTTLSATLYKELKNQPAFQPMKEFFISNFIPFKRQVFNQAQASR